MGGIRLDFLQLTASGLVESPHESGRPATPQVSPRLPRDGVPTTPSLSRNVRMPDSAETPARSAPPLVVLASRSVPPQRFVKSTRRCHIVVFSHNRMALHSKFSHPNQTCGPEALKNFDETLCLEFGVKIVVARVDSNGFQADEFGRSGHAQDVAVADGAKHIGRKLRLPRPMRNPWPPMGESRRSSGR